MHSTQLPQPCPPPRGVLSKRLARSTPLQVWGFTHVAKNLVLALPPSDSTSLLEDGPLFALCWLLILLLCSFQVWGLTMCPQENSPGFSPHTWLLLHVSHLRDASVCFQLPLGQWGQTQQETPTVTAAMGEVLEEESPLGENEDGPLKTAEFWLEESDTFRAVSNPRTVML